MDVGIIPALTGLLELQYFARAGFRITCQSLQSGMQKTILSVAKSGPAAALTSVVSIKAVPGPQSVVALLMQTNRLKSSSTAGW